KRFDNLEGVKGNPDSDQHERVHNIHLVQQWHYRHRKLSFFQTLRYDYFAFVLEDLFLSDGLQNGRKTFHQWNGGLGAQYEYSGKNHVFLHVNTGFETPTLQELSNNPDQSQGF